MLLFLIFSLKKTKISNFHLDDWWTWIQVYTALKGTRMCAHGCCGLPSYSTALSFSYHYVFLTHSWDGSQPEVQHEVLLEDVPEGGGGAEDGGSAHEPDALVLGRWTLYQSDLVQFIFIVATLIISQSFANVFNHQAVRQWELREHLDEVGSSTNTPHHPQVHIQFQYQFGDT